MYDLMKESPSSYVYRVSSLAIVDDVVTGTKPGSRIRNIRDGPWIMQHESAAYNDYTGAELTEEEYYAYAAAYYDAIKMQQNKGHISLTSVIS